MADRHHQREISKALYPRRGEIYLVALDPTVGREIRKTRPALVLQNDTSNEYLGTTIVAPITSAVRLPLSPVQALIMEGKLSGLSVTSMALLDQIRTVDKRRLVRRLGRIDGPTMGNVDEAAKICLGLRQL